MENEIIMQITEAEMKLAGEIVNNYNWTDEKLALLIKATRLTIAFLESRGPSWTLATNHLRKELSTYEGFAKARKQG